MDLGRKYEGGSYKLLRKLDGSTYKLKNDCCCDAGEPCECNTPYEFQECTYCGDCTPEYYSLNWLAPITYSSDCHTIVSYITQHIVAFHEPQPYVHTWYPGGDFWPYVNLLGIQNPCFWESDGSWEGSGVFTPCESSLEDGVGTNDNLCIHIERTATKILVYIISRSNEIVTDCIVFYSEVETDTCNYSGEFVNALSSGDVGTFITLTLGGFTSDYFVLGYGGSVQIAPCEPVCEDCASAEILYNYCGASRDYVIHFADGDETVTLTVDPDSTDIDHRFYQGSVNHGEYSYTVFLECGSSFSNFENPIASEPCYSEGETLWALFVVSESGVKVLAADTCQDVCCPPRTHWSYDRTIGGWEGENVTGADG